MREGAHKQFAQTMRREMTDAKRKLWLHLRRKQLAGFRFRRQHSIGAFVADFACLEAKLVVEVDGSQHSQSVSDARRDETLQEFGFRVVRFWNNDVMASTDKVLADILQALASSSPLPACGHLVLGTSMCLALRAASAANIGNPADVSPRAGEGI